MRTLPAKMLHLRMTWSVQTVRRAAWYLKPRPIFSDALALVRQKFWAHATFRRSQREPDTVEVPRSFVEHLTKTLCYAT
jgi:hypothetical protein